jgi:hypothetical protein
MVNCKYSGLKTLLYDYQNTTRWLKNISRIILSAKQ